MKLLSFALWALEWSLGNWVPLKGARRLPHVDPLFGSGRNNLFPSHVQTILPSFPNGSSPPTVKSRLCNKLNTLEGCKFGDKCHFSHGEWEPSKLTSPTYEDPCAMGPMLGRMTGKIEPLSQGLGAVASFGASATAKTSIDASLFGAIIGKKKKWCEVKAYLSYYESQAFHK